jgi:hypothetical protein
MIDLPGYSQYLDFIKMLVFDVLNINPSMVEMGPAPLGLCNKKECHLG